MGFAYRHGLVVANWEWLNGPALLLLVAVFVPVYLRSRVVTMPQFLEMRFDRRTRVLFTVITILTYVFINMAGVIYSGGFAMSRVFGIPLAVVVMCLVQVLYVKNGLEAASPPARVRA